MPPKPGGTSRSGKANGTLGRALLKNARQVRSRRKGDGTGFHVADIADSNNPLRSVTELTSLEDFMSTAVMADRTFVAEKAHLTFVDDSGDANAAAYMRKTAMGARANVDTAEDNEIVDAPSGVVRQVRIPRRPAWTETTTPDELHAAEKDAFLEWRRAVAMMELEHGSGLNMTTTREEATVTPFEKNIEVWRQLWRVVERSDVLVQIVDARNPLLFYCADLVKYVGEVNPAKVTLLVCNKADFLTPLQRLAWARYLTAQGIQFVFFSAKREARRLAEEDRINTAAKATLLGAAAVSGSAAVITGAAAEGVNAVGRDDLHAIAQGVGGPMDSVGASSATKAGKASATVARTVAASSRWGSQRIMSEAQRNPSMLSAIQRALLEEGDSSSSEGEEGETDAATTSATDARAPASLETEDAVQPPSTVFAEPSRDAAVEAEGEDSDEEREDSDEEDEAAPSGMAEFAHASDMTGIALDDPLYSACRVLTRDELIDYFMQRFGDLPRGVLSGPADKAAQRKLAEIKAKRKADALAARAEELRRRQIMTQRLVEVGLGSQVRFGDVRDLTSLEAADEEVQESDEEDGTGPRTPLTVGMVGYPNVGKSSTINALLGATALNHAAQRVAVASTPGKTKHFQTLQLNDDIMLCDCPGLVFPSFVATKEEMVVNGVLPIDQLRDYVGPIRLLCQRIARSVWEATYGITLPRPAPPQPASRQPTVYELLDTYCRARGYMAAVHAGADKPRGARVLLKDYTDGRIVYSHPPPGGWREYLGDADAWRVRAAADRVAPAAGVLSEATGAESATEPATSASGSGRITFADNVLLPRAVAVARATSAVHTGIAAVPAAGVEERKEEGAPEEVADEEEAEAEEEESLADEEELAALDVHAFSRRIQLVNDDNDEELEYLEDVLEDVSTGHGAASTVRSAAGSKLTKKDTRGLKKPRRRRKGEGHEEDPYNTSAAADDAMRSYHLAEVAAVSTLPEHAAMGSDLGAELEAASARRIVRGAASNAAVSRKQATAISKSVHVGGGVKIVESVPASVRGGVKKQ